MVGERVLHHESSIRIELEEHRRLGQLAHKLPFARDAKIAEMLADGAGVRVIKAQLGVGQDRIQRVLRTIREWVPSTKWSEGEEETDE